MKHEISKYQAPAGKLLIKPLKQRVRMVETRELDHEKNKDKDPIKEEMETKLVKSKAPYEIQLAEVVNSGAPEYPIGSIIVYSIKFAKEFDLFKNTFLLSNYDAMGSYKMNES